MKHSTEYLFDRPRDDYEPVITILAKMRIDDGRKLMSKLSRQRDNPPHDDMVALINRYQAVEKSVEWWEGILDET